MAVFSLDPTFFQNLKVYIQNITNSKQILTSSPFPKQSFFPFMSENLFEVDVASSFPLIPQFFFGKKKAGFIENRDRIGKCISTTCQTLQSL